MQRKKLVLLWLLFVSIGLARASAITLEQIAGTYEGWRTETTASGAIRYQEIDEILPDGSFYTWLSDEQSGVVYTMYSVLTVDENGKIAGPYADILDIHGRQLQIKFRDGQFSVHASTHRTD
jgi:hypothetical protein